MPVSALAAAALGAAAMALSADAAAGAHAASSSGGAGGPIQNVVVMMLENRAFDHLLGFMNRGGPFGDTRVDGLTGHECNPKTLLANETRQVCVTDEAKDVCPYDPTHSFAATTERIFACSYGHTPDTPCTNMSMTTGNNSMMGFVASAVQSGPCV
jgi:phospholipase C